VWKVVCRPDPQKSRPCVRKRILSHHASFYDSPLGLRVSLRKLVKEKKVKIVAHLLYVTNVPLKAGLTYRHGTSGKC
jgi:hypothetical protein